MAVVCHLGFVVRVLDHPRRAFGGLYHCAKCGCNRYSSFDNMQVLLFCELIKLENAYSHTQDGVFGGFNRLNATFKRNILARKYVIWRLDRQNRYIDATCARDERIKKERKTKKPDVQWETGHSSRSPTASDRSEMTGFMHKAVKSVLPLTTEYCVLRYVYFTICRKFFLLNGEESGCCWGKVLACYVLLLSCDICWLKYEFSASDLLWPSYVVGGIIFLPCNCYLLLLLSIYFLFFLV